MNCISQCRYYLIETYCKGKDLLLDVGSKKGSDIEYWFNNNVKRVIGLDISQNCINTSKKVVAENAYSNISLRRMDLSKPKLNLPPCDFASCVNVVMLPALKKNFSIISNIQKTLKKNRIAVFVIPSLESKLFTAQQLIRWHEKDGVKAEEIPGSEFSHISKSRRATVQGLVKIDTEPTKHYLHVEILALFASAGFTVTAIEKLQYSWTTEFETPPKWMREPFPWDWLVECRKV